MSFGNATNRAQETHSATDDEPSTFVRNVLGLLERTEYRLCSTGEDFDAVFKLRYRAYRQYGFVAEAPDRATSDELDGLPNAYCFGVYIDNKLVSTLRLHHIDRDNPYGPAVKAYPDIMGPRINRGETCVNASMFAADPECAAEYRALPYVALRLMMVAYSHFNSTYCSGLIRGEHAAFYRRVFGASQKGVARAYPPISIPLMLYEAVCVEQIDRTMARFPFFRSTKAEQRLLFGRQRGDVGVPLTVLPTAKYLQQVA